MATKTSFKPVTRRTSLEVCLGRVEQPLGRLIYAKNGPREFSQFTYSEPWLANPLFFDISPDLRRQVGHQLRKPPSKNDSCFFLALADSEPDAWGRRVIARAHAKARATDASLAALSEIDYLTAVDDFSRVGALRLRNEAGGCGAAVRRVGAEPLREAQATARRARKRRVRGAKNTVEAKEVVGEVDGRVCVLIDDMIDTAGTICAAAEQLVERGATAVYCAATHGVFSGPAIDRLKNSVIEKVVITNTLPLPPEKRIEKIEVLSAAGIIADAIDAVFEDTSVSEIFDGQNQS